MNRIKDNKKNGDQREMVDYLLGRLSEERQVELEKRYFDDDELFAQLLLAEEQLIESYVHGELNQAERKRFERYFLAIPRVNEQVALTHALARRLGGPVFEQMPTQAVIPQTDWGSRWRAAFAFWSWPNWAVASLALVLISIYWLMIGHLRERPSNDQMQARRITEDDPVVIPIPRESDQAMPKPTPRSDVRPPRSSSESDVVIASLMPGLLRDEPAAQVIIPATARRLRVRLMLESEASYKNYLAVLQRSSGEEVWRRSGWRARLGGAVEIEVPTSQLVADEYLLLLSGLSSDEQIIPLAEYRFRLKRD